MPFRQITDGLSKTIFLGEKYVPVGSFGIGTDGNVGSDDSIYTPVSPCHNCANREAGADGLMAIAKTPGRYYTFGSYHQNIVPFVFGDSRVVMISTEVAGSVLYALADRRDGQPIPSSY